jgi:hypothetical protein
MQSESVPPEKESNSGHHARWARASRIKKWASEHQWELLWGLFFAWLIGRVVYPPEHRPYWVRVLQYSATDDATAARFKALKWRWNENPPRLGDVPVRLELIAADDATLEQKVEKLANDDETLLVIGHLPTSLTRKHLLTFMREHPPIPYIATSASADNLCENCGAQFLPWLQPSPSNTKEAESMLLFAKQQGKGDCLLVADQSPTAAEYSDELAKDISDSARSRDIRIVDTFKVGVGPLPSESDVQRLNPDCILYAGTTDIALTLWRSLPPRNQWLLVSDGVIENSKLGELARFSTDSVFFTYASNAADAAKSVYASDAVGIASELLEDLNRRGGDLFYRLRALTHFESVQSARHNLYLVMRDNSENRAWYACSSSWDNVCIFERNRRTNGMFHVWQQDDPEHKGELSMTDIDRWHPPVGGMTSARLASSTKAN